MIGKSNSALVSGGEDNDEGTEGDNGASMWNDRVIH